HFAVSILRLIQIQIVELFCDPVGQRFQEQCVHHAENSSVRAEAESQSEYGDSREAGILAQHAEGVARVLQKSFEHWQALELTVGFFELCVAPQANARGSPGFLRSHASPDIFLCEHFEMDLKFILELL